MEMTRCISDILTIAVSVCLTLNGSDPAPSRLPNEKFRMFWQTILCGISCTSRLLEPSCELRTSMCLRTESSGRTSNPPRSIHTQVYRPPCSAPADVIHAPSCPMTFSSQENASLFWTGVYRVLTIPRGSPVSVRYVAKWPGMTFPPVFFAIRILSMATVQSSPAVTRASFSPSAPST